VDQWERNSAITHHNIHLGRKGNQDLSFIGNTDLNIKSKAIKPLENTDKSISMALRIAKILGTQSTDLK
jgi:hypothetical protein